MFVEVVVVIVVVAVVVIVATRQRLRGIRFRTFSFRAWCVDCGCTQTE